MARPSTGLMFVLPALVVLAMLTAYPIAYTGLLSVTDNQGEFVGTRNFERVLAARATPTAFWNTLWWVGGSIVFQVLLGTATAILLNQSFRGRGAMRAITLIPWVVPGIVAATTWAWMFHTEFGIINYMLTAPGVIDAPVGWLTNADTVLPVMIAINVWKLFPFVAIMVLAGLQSIPSDLYEAARVDGASFGQEVRHVMLPGVRPVIVAVTLLLVIWALNAITIIYAITRGGPANRTLITPIQIFRLAFEGFQFGQAAALSVMFFGVAIVIVFLYIRALASERARMSAARLKRPGLSWPVILAGCVLLVAVCLFPFWWMLLSSVKTLRELYTVPPIWWPDAPTWDNYRTVLFELNIPRYFLNSVIISVGSTALALLLAIFASYGFARFDFRGKPLLQAFVLIGQLLPTAAIIVPLFITLRVLGLVNTYWGLILVYMIITLPLSVWMLTSYFKAIPPELDEAAIIDGASRLGVLFRITLPLSVPGIVAVCVYAFVTTWNEFIFALCFATDSSVKTLPIGLAEFSTEFNTDWGAVMAASVVMTLPIALLFLSMQRLFVGGLTAGATKG